MPNPPDRATPKRPNDGTLTHGTTPDEVGGSEVPLDISLSRGTPHTSPLGPPQQPDEIGRVGRYRVLRELGRGGMGIVYVAEDTNLRRRVAVKCLLPEVASRPGNRERFEREAWATAAVEHENVVAIHDVGQEKGLPFLVMPLLRGETLCDRLKRDVRLPLPEVIRIGREMARGLDALHATGLVHRDVKPGNVWLEAGTGRVKILDFGLARPDDGSDAVSLSGQVMGTPGYMAPEQVTGDKLDHRADLFSLGCILYEAATGRAAFDGPNVLALLANLALQAPAPPESLNPDLPPELSSLILSLIEKQPEHRPPTARDVIEQFDRMMPSPTAPVPLTPPHPHCQLLGTATPSAATVPTGIHPKPDPGPQTEPESASTPPSWRRPTPARSFPVWGWIAMGSATAVLAVGVPLVINYYGNGKQTRPTEPTTISTAPVDDKSSQKQTDPKEVSKPPEPTPEEQAEQEYRDAVQQFATDPVKAAGLFRAAAEKGNPDAQYRSALLRLYGGAGVATDRGQAMSWLHQAAERGQPPARAALGYQIARQGEKPERTTEARSWLARALPDLSRPAAEGDVEAQYALGLVHSSRASVAHDPKQAVKWFTQAAGAAHADAQFRLGRAYDYAVGASYDPVEAVRWYTAAAKGGHVLAAVTLGLLECEGWGGPKDEAKGLARISKVADDVQRLAAAGDPDAELLLGAMFSDGRGVKRDDAEAARWFTRAVDRGDPVAMNRLAGCYAYELGVIGDKMEAARLYRAAAEKSFPVAQYNLGDAFKSGIGVEKNDAEAARWLGRAAEAGLPDAQVVLGLLYSKGGGGVPKDEKTAAKWFDQAAAGYRHAADAGDVGAQFKLGRLYAVVLKDPRAAVEWYRKAAEQGHSDARKALEQLQ